MKTKSDLMLNDFASAVDGELESLVDELPQPTKVKEKMIKNTGSKIRRIMKV
jgi:hypothetical protein